MMAGTFLEVETTNDQTKAQLAQEQAEIANHPEAEKSDLAILSTNIWSL